MFKKTNFKFGAFAVILATGFAGNQAFASDCPIMAELELRRTQTVFHVETPYVAVNNCSQKHYFQRKGREARSRARTASSKAREMRRRARSAHYISSKNAFRRSAESFKNASAHHRRAAAQFDRRASGFLCY